MPLAGREDARIPTFKEVLAAVNGRAAAHRAQERPSQPPAVPGADGHAGGLPGRIHGRILQPADRALVPPPRAAARPRPAGGRHALLPPDGQFRRRLLHGGACCSTASPARTSSPTTSTPRASSRPTSSASCSARRWRPGPCATRTSPRSPKGGEMNIFEAGTPARSQPLPSRERKPPVFEADVSARPSVQEQGLPVGTCRMSLLAMTSSMLILRHCEEALGPTWHGSLTRTREGFPPLAIGLLRRFPSFGEGRVDLQSVICPPRSASSPAGSGCRSSCRRARGTPGRRPRPRRR